MQAQEDRANHMNGGYSKELNVQNVSYLMLFSSFYEKRYKPCGNNTKVLQISFRDKCVIIKTTAKN